MTEKEWRETELPLYMIREYPAEWSERKASLAGCACLRRVWELLDTPPTRRYLELMERIVEGEVSVVERSSLLDDLYSAVERCTSVDDATYLQFRLVVNLSERTSRNPLIEIFDEVAHRMARVRVGEKKAQCALIRDIFGNPFRPVIFAPSWRTDTVVSLACQMYESRDFSAMPILGDALQDAGCDSDDVLNHCRGPEPHVRGCWVVDRVLGKE